MKTITDIIEKLFPVVNVASVTTTLDGGAVYRFSRPNNTQGKCVVITSLPISKNEGAITQASTVIINAYAENFANGLSDDISITAIVDAVILVLEAYTSGTSEYFEFVIESQSLLKDIDDETLSYGSLRLRCTIET